ncbi:serine/threonine protein kinase [Trypanosoma theileri]|uniref:Serine/threonine protein kinase n=1 Tax=Trypanosoma theileri TaxID=67003 RepID=A0A1X0P078_9TRYP|nr:serine/threonine protein kinase [Trypanosoma theileri]ORC90198.1 serine/threonine protein kinase [Trypanosoma theileri]
MWGHCHVNSQTLAKAAATPFMCVQHMTWRPQTHTLQPSSLLSEPNSQLSSQDVSFTQQTRAASPSEMLSQESLGSQPQQQVQQRRMQEQKQEEEQERKQQLIIRQEDIRDEDFQRLEILGDGSYSVVVAARHLLSQQVVALKELSRRRLRDLHLEKQLEWEINVHRRLRHPNVVRMLSYYVTPQSVVLVLEMCPRGTLLQKLKETPGGCFDERRASRYLRQVARALVYLHQHGIAHRDLKLENVLLDGRGVARLGDFGWSKAVVDSTLADPNNNNNNNKHTPNKCRIHPTTNTTTTTDTQPSSVNPPNTPHLHGCPTSNSNSTSSVSPQAAGRGRLTVCGTLDYLSPEMLSGRPHTFKTDVWSLGVMLVEMLAGTPPFYRESQRDTIDAIREAAPQWHRDAQLTPAARELILAMLRKNPDERPEMAEVLQHPWTQQRHLQQERRRRREWE